MIQTRYSLPVLLLALLAPLTAQDKATVDFQKQVWPIFEKNCTECHQATHVDETGRRRRPKGKVELDSKAGIEKSKGGKLVIAKKPDDSMIIESISLPADDEDRMPPPKKGPPLSKEQIELIKRWIEQGADFGKWTGGDAEDAGGNDKPKADDKPKTGGRSSSSKPKRKGPSPLVTLSKGLRPLPPATIAAFADTPFQVHSVGDENPLLRVECTGRTDDVDDRALAQLEPLLDHITELDLARSRVGDGASAMIAKMPRLTVLDLRQTEIGNDGVKDLAQCKELRSLNLFDTKVGDYALAALESLKHLENLYVWQTDASAKAVVKLREAIPGLRVVFTADLPEPNGDLDQPRRRR